ncbi:MAG: ABC transporter ATP-binding protein, partial [Myxococcota bacterium]
PFALAAIPWSYRLLDRGHEALIAAKDPVVAGLVETLDGLATLRSFGAEERAAEALHGPMRALEQQQMRTEVLPAPAILVFGLLVNLGFALTIAVGSTLPLDPIRFVLALVLSLHFTRTLSELVIYLAEARFAARTLRRIRALFALEPQPERALVTPPSGHRLVAKGVRFAYDTRPALRGVDVTFEPGTVTALVGPSGSGKSTLAHLVSRLWDVDDGAIELGGVDVRQMPLAFLHRQIATVFQDVVLFQGTVADNIRLGRPDATDDEVRAAARSAHAHDFVEALPEGYETLLGPGGQDLSGGQRQRLSIARALLLDAPILVLDEATASVDPDTEHLIQQALSNLMRGRTVVVVAHRLWTVQQADQIVVLDDGAVVQRGTHAELVEADGRYRAMWEAQQASFQWSVAASRQSESA